MKINLNFTSNISLISGAFLLLTMVSSCSKFLDLDTPKSYIEKELIFTDDVTATAAVLGIYTELHSSDAFSSGGKVSVLSLAGLTGDELVDNLRSDVNNLAFERNDIRPNNSYIGTLWNSLYKIIYQSNTVIEGLNLSKELTPLLKDQLMGEALFIRAFCNFYLVNLFGNVPLVLTTDYKENMQISKSDASRIYDQVIADLIDAQELLAEDYVYSQNERIRPNKFTALALSARVYLYLGKWELAENMASEIINNSGVYDLCPDLSAVFFKNSIETIWQLMPNSYSGNGTAPEADLYSPSAVLYGNVLRNAILADFESSDARRIKWIDSIALEDDTIYFPAKYKQYQYDQPLTEYSMVFRLAEQYLIRAEARLMQSKLVGENSAAEDINEIRNRSNLPNTTSTSMDDLLEDIIHERKIELLNEWGHRWFDLKRWDKADQILGAIKGSEWQITDTLYPLPQIEMSKNPNLKPQNTGY